MTTSRGAGFIFGFVGRTDPASEGHVGHEVWTSWSADASLLAGLNKTAAQVLDKHRADPPGTYCLPFEVGGGGGDDEGGSCCYTLVKVPCPPSKVFSLHDATPLPSQLGAAGSFSSSSFPSAFSPLSASSAKVGQMNEAADTTTTTSAKKKGTKGGGARIAVASSPPLPLLPRVVFGVIVHRPQASRDLATPGPSPDECTRWLESLAEMFERKYCVAGYSAPRGFPFEAFGRRIKDHASGLRHGGGGGGEGSGAVFGGINKIQEVNDKMREVRMTMVDNIARVLERGEKLDDVLVKSDSLQSTANMFKRTATRLKNRMWWQNVKMWLAVAAAIIFVVVIIFLAACRGVACVV